MDTPMSAIPRPSQQTVNVVWLDVNSNMGLDNKPDLLPDVAAVNNSLFNLFSCPVGARGPIFNPEYGTVLMRLLHEPTDYYTANKIRAYLLQAIARWETRIKVDMANSSVTPVMELPGYQVKIAYTLLATELYTQVGFQFSSGN